MHGIFTPTQEISAALLPLSEQSRTHAPERAFSTTFFPFCNFSELNKGLRRLMGGEVSPFLSRSIAQRRVRGQEEHSFNS